MATVKRDLRRCEALARQITAVRKKYGRYPAIVKEIVDGKLTVRACEVLPGMEDVEIPDLPDVSKLSPEEKFYYADNRKDFRQRIRPTLPREERLKTYSRDLHERVNVTRAQ